MEGLWNEKQCVAKIRLAKKYRVPELDKSITSKRFKQVYSHFYILSVLRRLKT